MDTTQRFSIFILALLFCQISALAQDDKLSPFNMHKLHPFWAQEYTGVDLLREKLQQSPHSWKLPYNLVQSLDSQSERHGEKVCQLIAGPHLSAPIPLEQPLNYMCFADIIEEEALSNWLQHCLSTATCPSYINVSMYFPEGRREDVISDIKTLIASEGITMVTSAGNDSVSMEPIKQELSASEEIVTVGNCSLKGDPYYTSNYSQKVTLCAPAGHYLTSYDFAGNTQLFGGTSGAAPMVTAALAAFTAITGYSLNPREAVRLLRKTAIPHPRLPTISNFGVGIVNVWKIGKIAFRLQDLCQKNRDCYADALSSEETFIFPFNKQEFIGHCQEEFLNELRKEALLNPWEKELWESIACINQKKGLQGHAKYYQQLAKRVESSDEELIDALWEENEYLFLARYVPFSHDRMEELFPRMINLPEINESILEAMALNLIGDEETLNQHEDFLQQIIFHPNIDTNALESIAKFVSENAERITGHYKFLRSIVDNHPKVSDAYTWYLIGTSIAANAKAIAKHRELLQMIIDHPKANSDLLWPLAGSIAKNAKIIPSHYQLLEKIIEHKETNYVALEAIASAIAENAKEVPRHYQLLEKIIEHKETNNVVLALIASFIAKHANEIPLHYQLLEKIINHEKANRGTLQETGNVIARNAQAIPLHYELLEKIIEHEKNAPVDALSSKRPLHYGLDVGIGIADNAENIPRHHQLLQLIIDHPVTNVVSLEGIANSITYKAKEIPGHYDLLKKIIYHPQMDKEALQTIARSIVNSADSISEHQELLQAIYTHPKMREGKLRRVFRFLHCSKLSEVYPPLFFIKRVAKLLPSNGNPPQNCQ